MSDLDKVNKVNKEIDAYGDKFQEHVEKLLFRTGMKSFFDKDEETK